MLLARFDRWTTHATALLLMTLAAYGLFSLLQLAGRWGVSAAGVGVLVAWSATAGWALATAARDPRRWEWVAFAAVALAWRLASMALAAPRVSPGDSHWYLVIAHNVLIGRGIVVDEPYMHLAVRAFFPPLYPVLLAGWTAVAGMSTLSLLVLSTAIDVAAALLIVRVGARLQAAPAGRAVALLYLVWPSTLFSAPLAQKEGLEVLLVMAQALGWIDAWQGRSAGWRRAVAIGVPAGLLALAQPGLALLGLLFGLALLPRLGVAKLLATGVPAAGVAVLVLLPWWWRNYLVFGQFVPLTSAGGISLWVGNSPGASGNWQPYPAELTGLPELAYTKAAGAIAWAWMQAHPIEDARLTLAKFLRATGLGEFGLVRLSAMRPALPSSVGAALFLTGHLAHVAMLAAGAVTLGRRRDENTAIQAALVLACVAQLLLFGVWLEFGERHREFMTPLLLLPVAAFVSHLFRRRTAPAETSSPPAAA
jgi:hypothetical protein